MRFTIVAVFIAFFSASSYSDAPVSDDFWQRNNNVKIDKIYVYWEPSVTRLTLDNGEVCFINKDDRDIFAIALSMHAQKAKGALICQIADSFNFEGKNAKRVHRIMVD